MQNFNSWNLGHSHQRNIILVSWVEELPSRKLVFPIINLLIISTSIVSSPIIPSSTIPSSLSTISTVAVATQNNVAPNMPIRPQFPTHLTPTQTIKQSSI